MRAQILVALTLVAVSGCTFTLVGNVPKTEDSIAHKKTVNATFAKSEQFVNACEEEGQNLAAIRYHTNPVYVIASVLSLGLYVPQNVTWWCGTESPACEDDEESEDCEPYVREDD